MSPVTFALSSHKLGGPIMLSALVAVSLFVGAAAEDPLKDAEAALKAGQTKEALDLATKAVDADPKSARARFVRGRVYEVVGKHAESVGDFDKAIELDPKLADAYDHRGSEQFRLGKVKESLADFDKFLDLKPEAKNSHWKRGISLYYAGKYEEGAKQFDAYQKISTDDVENSVWHYICNARVVGAEKARKQMLKIGKDKRVPMMEVYDLFLGKARPDDVLKAVAAGDPKGVELRERQFLANLYLALYYDSEGDKKKALEHATKAADDAAAGGYMGDVARVHRDSLKKEK